MGRRQTARLINRQDRVIWQRLKGGEGAVLLVVVTKEGARVMMIVVVR